MRSIKEMDKRLDEREQEIERLNNIIEKTQQEYTDEYNLRHKLSLELSVEKDKVLEIERLNKKYNKALELLADDFMPCEFEECIIPDDYCEENCSDDDYKKCWDKYIELELIGSDKE